MKILKGPNSGTTEETLPVKAIDQACKQLHEEVGTLKGTTDSSRGGVAGVRGSRGFNGKLQRQPFISEEIGGPSQRHVPTT